MNHLTEALTKIVHSCRISIRLSDVFSSELSEKHDNIFDDLAGWLEDALYFLSNQQTVTLQESTVDRLLRDNVLTDGQVAEELSKLVLINQN